MSSKTQGNLSTIKTTNKIVYLYITDKKEEE